ncbi:CocE/NonD family hydrolase [Krasilnikovia sp. MM14-A1259]|uniref:CocE/NonD family hydrolase n=1 Tax=Krasilnikovia sp. MM14-A1259 TaxID=3373539 RepID=UPI0038132002
MSVTGTGAGREPGRLQRLADAALGRALGHVPARNTYRVDRAVGVPMRDGVTLLADHYAPVGAAPRGTVLIRTPYGRDFPDGWVHARTYAARGYHVVVVSVRGTAGSGGTFRAMAQETDDGQDTVRWLRTRVWFDGRLATLGGSYLGWAQWTLLQDPPPEMRAALVYVAPHDFHRAVFGTGSFTLADFFTWSAQVARPQEPGLLRRFAGGPAARRRLAPGLHGLPLADAARSVLAGHAPWYGEWLGNAERGEEFWAPYRATAALGRVDVPVLLVGGWQDMFLDQTLEQYRVLRGRGVDVALTVGPWTHVGAATRGAGMVGRDTLAWLDEHVAGGTAGTNGAGDAGGPNSAARPAGTASTGSTGRVRPPVRMFRTGERAWHDLPFWPPATVAAGFHPYPDGRLEAAGPADATVTFRYDPADPTPSVGGAVLAGTAGVRDNRPLESRADVVTFTTAPLDVDLDVAGTPVLELTVAVDNPYADVFARVCDVDARGRSRNVADVFRRLDPAVPAGEKRRLRLTLDACFHRFVAGHRLRLLVCGGAHPRYARNLGTPGTIGGGSALTPARHTVSCGESRLILPVVS